MLEGDEFKPDLSKKEPLDAGGTETPPPGGDIQQLRQRLQELETGHDQPTEYYLLDIQKNLVDINAGRIIRELETSTDDWQMSPSYWIRQHVDGIGILRPRETGSTEAQQDMENLSLAFLALTFPYHKDEEQASAIQFYNDYQYVQMERFGKHTESVQLSPQVTQTLSWLLDQLHIPHDFTYREVTIPFAPLEQTMQQAAEAYTKANPITSPEQDHEKQTDTQALMQKWKQQQTDNE